MEAVVIRGVAEAHRRSTVRFYRDFANLFADPPYAD